MPPTFPDKDDPPPPKRPSPADLHNPSKCWITIPGQCAQFTRSDLHVKSPADAKKCPAKRQKDEKCCKSGQKKGKRSLGPIVHEGLISLETDPSFADALRETMQEKLFKGNWSNGDAVKETKEPASGTSFKRPLQIAPCAPPSIFSIKNSGLEWNPSHECQQSKCLRFI